VNISTIFAFAIWLSLVVAFLGNVTLADVLVTKSGGRWEGTITDKGDVYQVVLPNGSKMTFPKSAVAEVTTKPVEAANKPDTSSIPGIDAEAQRLFDEGTKFLEGAEGQRDVQKGLRCMQAAASRGHVVAMFNLGTMYSEGTETDQNTRAAIMWYQKAAEKREPRAAYNLGLMFANGTGVAKNMATAVEWFKKAAEMNYENNAFGTDAKAVEWYKKVAEKVNARAAQMVGQIFFNGDGIPKNREEAAKWFRRAADMGNAEAAYNLGSMYYEGSGIPKDPAKAFALLLAAANKGHGWSMASVAKMYQNGEGTRADPAKALEMSRKAAVNSLAFFVRRVMEQSDDKTDSGLANRIGEAHNDLQSFAGQLPLLKGDNWFQLALQTAKVVHEAAKAVVASEDAARRETFAGNATLAAHFTKNASEASAVLVKDVKELDNLIVKLRAQWGLADTPKDS
jgi:TPR repeat protein